ncbi:host cell division inhibitor Icd-like protein [Muribacter muris]|uniref:Host cell division inhibitor Icd-like protein n=1 Tax=Muribacter muris TaxID=67855 RepID=A0A4Y9JTU6_9PAST|nr:host cell division inhibitor Icd-like protein [Muribacter muris]MBF0786110.1 host cell division inhibitor Icd-like protein [Muribacter muris]TFV07947.1 host cell division inhibitor Icd-like protein [Muribacter muris]
MKETKTPVADFTTYQKNHQKHFTSGSKSVTFRNAQAKSCAEPGNSFNLLQGEQHANCAFFVRSLFTPKERPDTSRGTERLSMVVRNGKGSPFAVILVGRFSSPLRTTAQTLESLAVVPEIFIQGLSTMIYQFIGISRQHYDKTKAEQIRILAHNETQARALKAREYVLLLVGRLPDSAFNAHTFNAMEVVYA